MQMGGERPYKRKEDATQERGTVYASSCVWGGEGRESRGRVVLGGLRDRKGDGP